MKIQVKYFEVLHNLRVLNTHHHPSPFVSTTHSIMGLQVLNTWVYPKCYTHASSGVKWHVFNYVGETPLTRVHYITNPNNALLYKIPPPKKTYMCIVYFHQKNGIPYHDPCLLHQLFCFSQTPTSKMHIGTSMAKSLHILRCFFTTCCGNGSTNLGKKTIYARNLQNPDVALCGISLY